VYTVYSATVLGELSYLAAIAIVRSSREYQTPAEKENSSESPTTVNCLFLTLRWEFVVSRVDDSSDLEARPQV